MFSQLPTPEAQRELEMAVLERLRQAVADANIQQLDLVYADACEKVKSPEGRAERAAILGDFCREIRNYALSEVTEILNNLDTEGTTIQRAVDWITKRLALEKSLSEILTSKAIGTKEANALRGLLNDCHRRTHAKIMSKSEELRLQFSKVVEAAVALSRDLEANSDSPPESFQDLSAHVIDIYDRSRVIEQDTKLFDINNPWHLTKKVRFPLRITAKRLTELGFPTELAIVEVTPPPKKP